MRKKMLVVDDNPVLLRLMENLLTGMGHEVLTAKDGISALELLQTYIPHVMFVDMIMPKVDGEKLCRIIRSTPERKDVHLVVLTAIAAEKDIDFTAFGANACIAKGPFKEVAGHIAALLRQLDAQTLPTGIIGLKNVYQREITKELLSSRRHLQAIINSMADGVLEITTDHKIIYLNHSALSLIGTEEEKILATDLPAFFKGIHRTRVRELLQNTTLGPQIVPESAPLTLNGRQITLRLLSLDDEGSRTIIVFMRDISSSRR